MGRGSCSIISSVVQMLWFLTFCRSSYTLQFTQESKLFLLEWDHGHQLVSKKSCESDYRICLDCAHCLVQITRPISKDRRTPVWHHVSGFPNLLSPAVCDLIRTIHFYQSSPESAIVTFVDVAPELDPTASTRFTTSSPCSIIYRVFQYIYRMSNNMIEKKQWYTAF